MQKLKLFEQFLNEKENLKDLQKVYAAVDTSTGHEWAREDGSEAFIVITNDNVDKIELADDMPLLNYNKKITAKLSKKFPNTFVYNPNNLVEKSSSKKKFHEILEGNPHIPKTAYSEKDAREIGFPLIAKPKNGHSGLGIKVFKTQEAFDEADKSNYDVFSQYIDKKSEHRLISFKGEPFVWMERTPLNDKAKNGAGTAGEQMHFKYVKKDPVGLPKNFAKVNADFCKIFEDLPLICFDVMEDKAGHVYIIESNTMTGMPFDISLNLYEKLFKDFYKKDISKESKDRLNVLCKGMIKKTLNREAKKWEIES